MSKVLSVGGMSREALLGISPEYVGDILLTKDEILHIFKELGGLWLYDYEVAKKGKVGLHAELKSGRCSDGFLNSKVILCHNNIRMILAQQLVMTFNQTEYLKPDYVAGIPDGATKLGEDIADILGVKKFNMAKENGKIKTITVPPSPNYSLLLVEDFCTKGTGFKEAVLSIISSKSDYPAIILAIELVIINRGGLKDIDFGDIDSDMTFRIVPLVEHRINDWDPLECPICKMGSERIKPKATEESWGLITKSQLV